MGGYVFEQLREFVHVVLTIVVFEPIREQQFQHLKPEQSIWQLAEFAIVIVWFVIEQHVDAQQFVERQ